MIGLPEGKEWVFQMINIIWSRRCPASLSRNGLSTGSGGSRKLLLPRRRESILAGRKRGSPQVGRRYLPVGKRVKSHRWRLCKS